MRAATVGVSAAWLAWSGVNRLKIMAAKKITPTTVVKKLDKISAVIRDIM
jgi:hypothetical protein